MMAKLLRILEEELKRGGIVGLTYDNRLILGRMSAEEAIEAGVRDAV